jgi:hypothetical protein
MKFYIKNGGSEPPKDSHYYIVAKNGVFLYKRNPVLETILPVKDIPVLKFQREVLDVKYPKIPKIDVLEIISFFFRNYRRYRGESIVLIHFSSSKGYKFHAPDQRVARGILDYSPRDRFNGYLLVGSIHCHGNLIAFHSSRHEFSDHEDEVDFDGLHITVGNINSPVITISCSVMVNGKRFILNPMKYMEGISEVKVPKVEFPIYGEDDKKMVESYKEEMDHDEKLYGVKVPFSLYWAPITGRKDWLKMVQEAEKNRNGGGNKMFSSLLKKFKTESDTKEKKYVEYLGNPFSPWIPFFFSADLPEDQNLKKVEFPGNWAKGVRRYPLRERLKVAYSQLGGDYGT